MGKREKRYSKNVNTKSSSMNKVPALMKPPKELKIEHIFNRPLVESLETQYYVHNFVEFIEKEEKRKLNEKEILSKCHEFDKIPVNAGDIYIYHEICPKVLHKMHKDGIKDHSEIIPSKIREILSFEGMKFEKSVIEVIDWETTKEPLSKLIKNKSALLLKPKLSFKTLNLHGEPDFLFTNNKNPIPIDVKSHSKLTKTDMLITTFYSYILFKKFGSIPPLSWVILKDNNWYPVKTTDHLEDIIRTITQIKIIKARDASPTYNPLCHICKMKEECISILKKSQDLTLIYNIGKTFRKYLHKLGIKTISDLANQNPDELYKAMKEHNMITGLNYFGGNDEVERWILRAQVMLGKKMEVKKIKFSGIPFYFDLEYDTITGGGIFSIAYGFEKNGKLQVDVLFADDSSKEKEILSKFIKIIKNLPPNSCIFTFFGKGADIPVLKQSLAENNLDLSIIDLINEKHTDLFYESRASIFIPAQEMKLKTLGKFFGFVKNTEISSGDEALALYFKYQETKDKEIKEKIIEYAKDDINLLKQLKDFLSK